MPWIVDTTELHKNALKAHICDLLNVIIVRTSTNHEISAFYCFFVIGLSLHNAHHSQWGVRAT